MRKKVAAQLRLGTTWLGIDHDHARELRKVSDILDEHAQTVDWVYADLLRAGSEDMVVDPLTGRPGMTAETALRALILKHLEGFSYEDLAFHLADSWCYSSFCRLGLGSCVPSAETLQRNLKQVTAGTLEAINGVLIEHARHEKIEQGRKIRVDCTVEQSNIHPPSDSWLLYDCVRVLTRLTRKARNKLTGMAEVVVHNHGRRAKRRFVGIENAKKRKDRETKYKDLLKVTSKTVGYAEGAAQALERVAEDCNDARLLSKLLQLAAEIRHYLELSYRVIDQTQRRVLGGEHVPSEQKIVSIFEPHTDILVKDRRDVYYGHKLTLSTGASGLVLDCVIEQGNPADSTLAVRTIERHKEQWGQAPRQASFDGGFASQSNLEAIKDLDVEDVVFSKGRGIAIPDMAKSSSVYKRMRRFRAGIEGIISFLKRCFGMWRCTYRGFESFKTYTWASVVSANLLLVARHQLG